ncbi:LacI family DNA-binding transcriptional regulator [Streptantibioticus silvisoli]|uniref:LacI family DNA-binding transcriptional regulator n=1 Tax=Streptantibioticus silvisoli TaxID=2705255 RepID=A0ABT6VXQ4_9ACTN|nr:LacI family DNA-binding transcriptional regulator [Streptantibioticus silvisoli]MDI5962522.1 LacI family DNA-binding transcriptional regulator [Streptantibioticus silvisoli]
MTTSGGARRSSPGAKRATLAEVAALAEVSVMTASYTYSRPARVSDEARAKVLAAAERLGYAGPDPRARSLRRGSTQTLGVVLGEHLTYAFEDPQAARFLAGIAQVCTERGYGMTILPVTGAPQDAARVRAAAVDGFVVWTTAEDDPVLDAVRAVRRPAVVHGGPAVPGLGLVGVDNRAAARAVGAAAFAGAARPAVISFPLSRSRETTVGPGAATDGVLFPVTRDRLEGYRLAAADAGFRWDRVTVAVCARNDAAEAEAVAARLLALPEPPDAIAAMSDEQAAGVVRAARTAGRSVPRELSVTGWDDADVAVELGLTSVAQSLRDQGAACARAALDGGPAVTVAAPWTVVRRASTRG